MQLQNELLNQIMIIQTQREISERNSYRMSFRARFLLILKLIKGIARQKFSFYTRLISHLHIYPRERVEPIKEVLKDILSA